MADEMEASSTKAPISIEMRSVPARCVPARRSSKRRAAIPGIGLAMVCAQKGYRLVIVMADSFSVERRKLMRMLTCAKSSHASCGEGLRHVSQGRMSSLRRRTIGFSPTNSKPKPMPTCTKARQHGKSSTTSLASDWIGSLPGMDGGNAGRRWARVAPRAPRDADCLSEPANAQLVGSGVEQQRASDGAPLVSHSAWDLTRSRAGRPTSFRSSCRKGSIPASMTKSSRLRVRRVSNR